MAAHSGEPESDSDDRVEETNLPLLDKTQAYLRATLDREAPDSLLAAAWDEFYRVYNELIRRFVISRQIPYGEVEDCVQEVWLAIAKHLADFQHPRERPGLRSWLYTLVRSKTTDVVRNRARAARSLDALGPDRAEPADHEPHPDVWTRLLLETLLDDAIAHEPPETVRILTMRLYEGHRTAEIARLLGVSPDYVRYRFQRVLKRIRASLAFYQGESIGTEEERPGEPSG